MLAFSGSKKGSFLLGPCYQNPVFMFGSMAAVEAAVKRRRLHVHDASRCYTLLHALMTRTEKMCAEETEGGGNWRLLFLKEIRIHQRVR